MRYVTTFVLLLLTWLLLTWPFAWGEEGFACETQDVGMGVLVALLCTLVMRSARGEAIQGCGLCPGGARVCLLCPVRLLWLAAYLVVLAYYVVQANFDVAYRVLHPDMPICPGIVKIRTKLKSRTAIAALANSITLTPGTLTVNVNADGILYVHWICVGATDPEEAAKQIIGRFEWFLAKIFE